MRVYAINGENNDKRVLIDFKNPAPLVSIPLDMWMDGLKDFKGVWVSCKYSKTHTNKDRVLYTIYPIDYNPPEPVDTHTYVVIGDSNVVLDYESDINVVLTDDSSENLNVSDKITTTETDVKKGKLCLFYGIKDTTSEHWDKFCYMLRQKECELDDLGRSYREINIEDARCWWEFHIYDEGVKVQGHRPIPFYSEDLIDYL